MPPQKPRPSTIVSGTPSSAARATSGVWDENGIAVESRSSASSAKDPTGSSTFAMSKGSRSASARRAVSSRQPMFASSRSARSGPIAALTARTSPTSSSTGWTATLPSKTGESCSSTIRAQNAATSAGESSNPGLYAKYSLNSTCVRTAPPRRSCSGTLCSFAAMSQRAISTPASGLRISTSASLAVLDGWRLDPAQLGEQLGRLATDEASARARRSAKLHRTAKWPLPVPRPRRRSSPGGPSG